MSSPTDFKLDEDEDISPPVLCCQDDEGEEDEALSRWAKAGLGEIIADEVFVVVGGITLAYEAIGE